MNLIIGLPKSKKLDRNKYNTIATYIDLYLKVAYFMLTTKQVDTEGITNIHKWEIFWLHELPRGIISDRKLQFIVKVIKALYK